MPRQLRKMQAFLEIPDFRKFLRHIKQKIQICIIHQSLQQQLYNQKSCKLKRILNVF